MKEDIPVNKFTCSCGRVYNRIEAFDKTRYCFLCINKLVCNVCSVPIKKGKGKGQWICTDCDCKGEDE